MAKCSSVPVGGGRCELAEGHEGKHQKTSWPNGYAANPYVFTWDDESQRRLSDTQTSRFD